jgi:hypothetical protein
MSIQDDVRRLTQEASIYLGHKFRGQNEGRTGEFLITPFAIWYKGRLQQANDGNYIFRSISSDGTIVAFQLGPLDSETWTSTEDVHTGLVVQITQVIAGSWPIGGVGAVDQKLSLEIRLSQQLPQEIV